MTKTAVALFAALFAPLAIWAVTRVMVIGPLGLPMFRSGL